MKKTEEFLKNITSSFQYAMRDVESLNEFFYRSNKTLFEYQLHNENSCFQGKKIADIFDSILDCNGKEERNNKINEVNDIEIEPGIKLSDVCKIIPFDDDKNTLRYSINDEFKNKSCYLPTEAKKKYEHIVKYEYILQESILSHIIVSFENYLSEIYNLLLITNPLLYFENQTILLADVFKDNFNEAIMNKVETEIESKMRNSLDALNYICNKENINIDRYEKILEVFEEIYYRRNAYIHTMGRANKDYMKKVNSKFTKSISSNDFLVCDDIYIKNSIIVLCKLMFSIAYELLVKYNDDGENIDVLAEIFFEKLKKEEYCLSKYVYYSLSQHKSLPFMYRTMYRMNYINAAKQLGELDLVKSELDELDISIATDDFKIGKLCLSDNNEEVYKMLQDTYPITFDAVAIREWPIFLDFRKTEFYQKFVSEHKDDFEIQCLVPESNFQNVEKIEDEETEQNSLS